jgi:hypothetical protein
MRKWSWLVTLAALAATPAIAQTSFPDLRGTWQGDSESMTAEIRIIRDHRRASRD